MRAQGADPDELGPDPEHLARISTFVELHVEQGKHLAGTPFAVAIGDRIWPHGRWRLTFDGAADHAGTTGLTERHDPMLAFAATVLHVRHAAAHLGARATIGKVSVTPNGTNAIASRVTAWLDARAPDEATVRALVEDVIEAARRRGEHDGVTVAIAAESFSPDVAFAPGLATRLAGLLGGAPLLPTGAGHDAGILAAAGVPSAMLFVRNPTGVSHSPLEHADAADCHAGVEALAAVLATLDRSP
jgi:N-carbamoyl-L-amino-acid hydrolase